MRKLFDLHDRIFASISNALSPWFIPTAARFTFASVLLFFFWNSAKTKLDGPFTLSLGSYAQIFPKKLEALGYDISQVSFLDTLIVYAGTYAEFILPTLIVIGLFTRLAAVGMIGFILVMTLVDITGHDLDAATIGAMFDRHAYGLVMDQRLLWIFVLLMLVVKGGGPLSLDRLIKLK